MKIDFSLPLSHSFYNDPILYKLLSNKTKSIFEESIEIDEYGKPYIEDPEFLDTKIKERLQENLDLISGIYDQAEFNINKEKHSIVYSFFDTEFPGIKINEKRINYYFFNIIKESEFNEYIGKLHNFYIGLAKLLDIKIHKPFEFKSNILQNSELTILNKDINKMLAKGDSLDHLYYNIVRIIFDNNIFYKYLAANFENSKKNGFFNFLFKRIDDEITNYKNILGFNKEITGEEVLTRVIEGDGGLLDFLIHDGLSSIFYDFDHYYNPYRSFILKNLEVKDSQYSSIVINIDDILIDIEDDFTRSFILNTYGRAFMVPEISSFLMEKKDDKQSAIIEAKNSASNSSVSDSAELIRDIFIHNSISVDENGTAYFEESNHHVSISYKQRLEIINHFFEREINNAKMAKLYNFIEIPPEEHKSLSNLIESFLQKYKQIVIKELQENQKYIQGKINSIKLFDRLKYEDTPINKLNIKIEDYYPDSDEDSWDPKYQIDLFINDREIDSKILTESSFNYTYLLYINNFRKILAYLSTFSDELYKILNITDLNKLKDHIIYIINFLIPSDNSNKFNKLINYTSERSSSGSRILEKINSDPKKKTKNEKLNLYYQALSLIHNNGDKNFKNFIVNSTYLTKLNSTSILEIFECIARVLSIINLDQSLNKIMKEKPKLLPNHIYTDFIKNIIDSILKAKDNNYGELDDVISNILKNDPPSNIRKLKYVTSVIANYEAISEWVDLAKEKEKDVFSANFSTESFRFRVLEDLDPYHFQVGVDTNCCQTIGGKGQSAAVDSFINPKAGVVVLEANNGGSWNLAAQSYFHVFSMNKDGKEIKGIILDNIEAGRLESKYKKDNFYPKAYAILGRYLKNKGFDIVGCGEKYTEVIKNNFALSSIAFDPRHFEVEEHNIKSYTDFKHKSFYDLLKPDFAFEMPNDIDSEIKMAKYNDILLKLSRFLSNTSLERESIKVYNLIY